MDIFNHTSHSGVCFDKPHHSIYRKPPLRKWYFCMITEQQNKNGCKCLITSIISIIKIHWHSTMKKGMWEQTHWKFNHTTPINNSIYCFQIKSQIVWPRCESLQIRSWQGKFSRCMRWSRFRSLQRCIHLLHSSDENTQPGSRNKTHNGYSFE